MLLANLALKKLVAKSIDFIFKLGYLKKWLGQDENRIDIPIDQLQVVIEELRSHDVGIRGSNTFTITYSLLWNVRQHFIAQGRC